MKNITDEERERRRQNMLELHRQGRAGAEFGKMGGRPRKPRMSEQVAEKVSQRADDYFERLDTIVMDGADKNSIAAFKELRSIEEQERKIIEEQEEKIDQLKRDELLALVRNQLAELSAAGTLDRIITVGESEVIRNEGLTELSENSSGT